MPFSTGCEPPVDGWHLVKLVDAHETIDKSVKELIRVSSMSLYVWPELQLEGLSLKDVEGNGGTPLL